MNNISSENLPQSSNNSKILINSKYLFIFLFIFYLKMKTNMNHLVKKVSISAVLFQICNYKMQLVHLCVTMYCS